MLGAGAQVNARDDSGSTPLMCLAFTEGADADVAKTLGEKGGNREVNAVNGRGETAATMAAAQGNLSLLQALCGMGATLGVVSEQGHSVLTAAAVRDQAEVLAWVLTERRAEAEALLQRRDRLGRTALEAAVGAGKLAACQALLENSACMQVEEAARQEEQREQGVLQGLEDKVEQEREAALRQPGVVGAAGPEWTAGKARKRKAELLRQHFEQQGVTVQSSNRFGLSLLMLAAQRRDLAMTQLLLRHGADVDAQAHDGTTALHLAVRGKQPEVGCDQGRGVRLG